MTWVRVLPSDDSLELATKLAMSWLCFKHTANESNDHLQPSQISLKLAQRMENTDQPLFELYLYNEGTVNNPDYTIVLAFSLSLHRASRPKTGPKGDVQKWDWSIHTGVRNYPNLSDEQVAIVYGHVIQRCSDFLTALDNDASQPHASTKPVDGKRLLLTGDGSINCNDRLYDLFHADRSAGKISATDLTPDLNVSTTNYHSYLQARPVGLGVNGLLRRIHITAIT